MIELLATRVNLWKLKLNFNCDKKSEQIDSEKKDKENINR